MATSGELRTILEELKLIAIGDAADYLGEEANVEDECMVSQITSLSPSQEDVSQKLFSSTCSISQQQAR
jgi:hypothetical protein